MNFKLLLLLFLMLLVALFGVQNAGMITVRFLAWQFEMSQALVIMLAAFSGALAGLIAGAVGRRKKPSTSAKSAPLAPPSSLE